MRSTGDGQSKPVISDTFRTGGCKSNHFDGPAPSPPRHSSCSYGTMAAMHENEAPLTIDDLVCAFDIAYPTLDGHRCGLQICAPQAVHDIIPRGAPGRRRRRRRPPGRPFQYMRQARDERCRLLRPDLIPSPPGRPFQYVRQARDERRRLLRPDLIPSPPVTLLARTEPWRPCTRTKRRLQSTTLLARSWLQCQFRSKFDEYW